MIDDIVDDPFEDPGPKPPTFYVWMHKETGDLYEKWHCWFGDMIAWEDLSKEDKRMVNECKLKFEDEFDIDDYVELSLL